MTGHIVMQDLARENDLNETRSYLKYVKEDAAKIFVAFFFMICYNLKMIVSVFGL